MATIAITTTVASNGLINFFINGNPVDDNYNELDKLIERNVKAGIWEENCFGDVYDVETVRKVHEWEEEEMREAEYYKDEVMRTYAALCF